MQCTSPRNVFNPKIKRFITVPCGMCMHCRLQKTREWSLRILNELNYWNDACFITLTYSDDTRPTLNGEYNLVKSDLQKFLKRLRKRIEPRKIKYFCCGEYGDNTGLPHYHGIIFGVSIKDMKKMIHDLWSYGDILHVGDVNKNSAQYVTGYVRKKLNGSLAEQVYGERQAPFQIVSQGIGLRFAEEYKDNIAYGGLTLSGNPVSIPRYYSKKVEEVQKVIKERQARSFVKQAKKFGVPIDNIKVEAESYDSKVQRSKNIKALYELYDRTKI